MPAAVLYIIPGLVLIVVVIGFLKGVPCFDSFVKGAKEGAMTIVKLTPSLIGLIVAISVFRASGAMDIPANLLAPVLRLIGLEKEVLPLVIVRPISGSASLALLRDILQQCGPDSLAGYTACVMMGSTETVIYTLAVYMGDSGIKKAPGVLAAALFANLFPAAAAGMICSFLFF